jgi:hypothetical protein
MQPLIDPAGRPHISCLKCRTAVVWPSDLDLGEAAEFARTARVDSLAGQRFAEAKLGLGPREAKALALHVSRPEGRCHKCGEPVPSGESLCSCRSANINW